MRKFFCLAAGLLFYFCIHAQTVSGDKSFCERNIAILNVTGVPGNSEFIWQFSEKGNDPWADLNNTNYQPSYTATKIGFYRVRIISTNKISNKFEVVDSKRPTVSFTNDNDNKCSGTDITFTPAVSGGVQPYTYDWQFADGGTSAAEKPVYALEALGCGTHNMANQLTVTDANGCSNTATGTVTVIDRPDVQLQDMDGLNFRNCDNSPTTDNPTYTINVNNISPSASCINSYSIDWGDGEKLANLTASSFPLTHTYKQLGAYNLTVTADGKNGCTGFKTYTVANQSNPAGGLGTLGATTNLCAPADIPFVISNWENNSPGTTYQLNFGDNEVVTLQQPLQNTPGPYTLTHTYKTSSCTFGSGTFTAYLTAINACSTTPYSAGNIQINTKGEAKFDAPLIGCVNQDVCFANQSTKGFAGSSCASGSQFSWNFGDPNSGSSNTSNIENVCHKFIAPGTYTVTLTNNTRCGVTTATQEVCILPVPVPSFTMDKSTGCGQLSVNISNTSNTLTGCAESEYQWTVTYKSGSCGTSAYEFTKGTSETSVNPSFLFTNEGTYNLQLSIKNPCGTFTANKDIVVTAPPAVTIESVGNACGTSKISPVAKITNCKSDDITYKWSFPGGVPATSTEAVPGEINYSQPGNYTITLEATNDCGTTKTTQTFTVGALPELTVPPSASFCSGEAAGPFAFSGATGSSITWMNDNTATGLGSGGTGNISAFTTANTTNITQVSHVSVMAAKNGCTATQMFEITVSPELHPPIVSSPVNDCIGDAAKPLSATAGAGNTLLWYTEPAGGTSSSTAPTPDLSKPGTSRYYVSQTAAGSTCESQRAEIVVNVHAIPTFTAVANNPSSCGSTTGFIRLEGLEENTSFEVQYTQNG